MVRAKFQVTEVAKNQYGSVKVTLSPQYDQSIEEDRRFAKATPSGTIRWSRRIEKIPCILNSFGSSLWLKL